jgi:hypothetical protein
MLPQVTLLKKHRDSQRKLRNSATNYAYNSAALVVAGGNSSSLKSLAVIAFSSKVLFDPTKFKILSTRYYTIQRFALSF